MKANNMPSFIDAIEAALTDDEAVQKKSTSTRIQYSDAAYPRKKFWQSLCINISVKRQS